MDWQRLPHAPRPGDRLCALADVADGGVLMLTRGDGDTPFRLLVLRSGDRVYGYLNRCAHFGVPLADTPEHLIFKAHETISCNVHYARYEWRDGRCLAGECAGERLVALPLRVSDGEIYIGAA